jgi:hypothetical protein
MFQTKIYDLFGDEILLNSKSCVYCGIQKKITEFPKHIHRNDGYDSRCKECKSKRGKLVDQIRKNSPPKPKICDCCGKKPKEGNGRRKIGLALDHCPKTNTFRGWLCFDCNLGIGLLGDDTQGLKRALDYLVKHDRPI